MSATWQAILAEYFDYDLYANRLWLPLILSSGQPEEKTVFSHIIAASTIWLARLDGVSHTTMPEVEFSEECLNDLHAGWLRAVASFEFEQSFSYRNLLGDAYVRSFGDIVRHVVNHGTYHRGQIRAMYGARRAEFPDTDFLGFSFERDEAV